MEPKAKQVRGSGAAKAGSAPDRAPRHRKNRSKNPPSHSQSADGLPRSTGLFRAANPHRRTGKVARLPKAARDRINQMICDGRLYAEIIDALGEDGKGLNEDNMTNWKAGGYGDWLREQTELQDARLRQEYVVDLARETEGTSLCEAASKMLIAQIFEALREAGGSSLQIALAEKPEIYVQVLHAMARLSTEAISCERHRLREAAQKAKLLTDTANSADKTVQPETVETVADMLRTR